MDKKPTTLEDIVAQIKKEGHAPKRSRRRWKRKPKEYEGQYTPSRAASQKAFWSTVSGTWKHLTKTYRSRAKARGEENKWKISLEDWKKLWETAGSRQLTDGSWISYFALRGRSKDACKLWRIDEAKDWTLDNVVVLYKGQVVANGRQLSTGDS